MKRALHIFVLMLVVSTATSVISPSASAALPRSGQIVYGGPISRAQVMARAADWFRRDIPYSQDNSRAVWDVNRGRRYRTDCSGFVSMAWALDSQQPGLGRAPVTWELPSFAFWITWKSLRPGDALLRVVPANHGLDHVQLFQGWVDRTRTRAWVIEESGTVNDMRRTLIFTVPAIRSGYIPYRYRKVY